MGCNDTPEVAVGIDEPGEGNWGDIEPLIRSLSEISPLSNDGNAILISSPLQPLALRAV